MYYKIAKLLKDVVWTFVDQSPGHKTNREAIRFPNFMKNEEKDYYRWRAKIVLTYFSPYYYNNNDRYEFYLDENQVKIHIFEEGEDDEHGYFFNKIEEVNISIDDFILNHLYWVELNYPKTTELMEMLMLASEEKC